MTTNDLKKGTMIQLRSGWKAKLEDNRKGNIRLATVYGLVTEMGSIYSHSIIRAIVDGKLVQITHTPAQLKCKEFNDSL